MLQCNIIPLSAYRYGQCDATPKSYDFRFSELRAVFFLIWDRIISVVAQNRADKGVMIEGGHKQAHQHEGAVELADVRGLAEKITAISPEWAEGGRSAGFVQLVIGHLPQGLADHHHTAILIPDDDQSKAPHYADRPEDSRGQIIFCDSATLPLPTESIDDLLIIGCLEGMPDRPGFISELSRIATARGHVTLVFFQKTRFWPVSASGLRASEGRPSRSEVIRSLRAAGFDIARSVTSRYVRLSSEDRPVAAPRFRLERIRSQLGALLGGVVVIRAKKQRYAPSARPGLSWRRHRRQLKLARQGGYGLCRAKNNQALNTG